MQVRQTPKKQQLISSHFQTISSHFFANYMFIFHKTEIQTVILSCLTGLNLDLVKSYGLRCNLRPRASSVNSQKIATDKQSFLDHIWPFFANYMFIFHKTEIQAVTLRCLMSLNLKWYKIYDKKHKNTTNAKDVSRFGVLGLKNQVQNLSFRQVLKNVQLW